MEKINIEKNYGTVIHWACLPRNRRKVYHAITSHVMNYYGGVVSGTLERAEDGSEQLRLDESLKRYGEFLPLPEHIDHKALRDAIGSHCSAVLSASDQNVHISLCVHGDPPAHELLIQDFITTNEITSVEELEEIISGNVYTSMNAGYMA